MLCHPSVAKRRIPVLLACSKQDMGSRAHTVDFIRKQLEKEIGQVSLEAGAIKGCGAQGGGGEL